MDFILLAPVYCNSRAREMSLKIMEMELRQVVAEHRWRWISAIAAKVDTKR
jgi:hypothetical protein